MVNKPVPTQVQSNRAEHLFYEMDMALKAWTLFGQLKENAHIWTAGIPEEAKGTIQNALMESALLHTRILYEFFDRKRGGGKHDDFKPKDLWPNSRRDFSCCPKKEMLELDKRLAHLCDRRHQSPTGDRLDFYKEAEWLTPLLCAMQTACDYSQSEGLDKNDWSDLKKRCQARQEKPSSNSGGTAAASP